MFSIYVRDHFMIAHSFQGEIFGPAQQLHGATYLVEVEFRRPALDPDGLVVDIGKAGEVLKALLSELNFKNLDEVAEFNGKNTTTEFLAQVIFERMAKRIAQGDLGPAAAGLTAMRVSLGESHVAGAAFEGSLPHATAS